MQFMAVRFVWHILVQDINSYTSFVSVKSFVVHLSTGQQYLLISLYKNKIPTNKLKEG